MHNFVADACLYTFIFYHLCYVVALANTMVFTCHVWIDLFDALSVRRYSPFDRGKVVLTAEVG
jgi:hypothetical protein